MRGNDESGRNHWIVNTSKYTSDFDMYFDLFTIQYCLPDSSFSLIQYKVMRKKRIGLYQITDISQGSELCQSSDSCKIAKTFYLKGNRS